MQQNIDETTFDVAVVGGGLAGLTAALTAARAGARVAVLEARTFGGRARSAERDGYVLNEGAHALYRGAGGYDVLTDLGITPTGSAPATDAYRVVWNGSVARLPVTAQQVLTSRLLSVRSKARLGRWYSDPDQLVASAPADATLDEWLAAQGARDDLRKLTTALCRLSTYSADPGGRPARSMIGQLMRSQLGVLYLDGGWQSLVDQLAASAWSADVRLLEHQAVDAIGRERGRWAVTTTDHTIDTATVILAAGGPVLATRLLGDDPAGWVARAGEPDRAAVLDIGGRHDAESFLLSADAPLYCSQHAPAARLAPDGAALHTLMRYLAPGDTQSAEHSRGELETHAERAGLPPTGERSLERFLARPTVTWGSPQVGVERPSGSELADRGLYAVGDWVGDRLLADASLVSGAAAGRAAARRAIEAMA